LGYGLRRAAWVTACSQFTLDDAERRFKRPLRGTSVIYNGIAPEEPRDPDVALPRRYVAALGRAVNNKGFDLLIDAFAAVSLSAPDLSLVIAGDGASLDSLRDQVRILSLEQRVHFTGALDRGGVVTLLSNAEVIVMPSRIEPFGIVVLEAWRAGCPVIASNRGGAPEYVADNIDGILVDPLDSVALSGALLRLLESPVERDRLSKAGLRAVCNFQWERIADRYEELLCRIGGAVPAAE
jgi:glycogen(starch) synthase